MPHQSGQKADEISVSGKVVLNQKELDLVLKGLQKPLYVGSIPTRASKLSECQVFSWKFLWCSTSLAGSTISGVHVFVLAPLSFPDPEAGVYDLTS
jgi:hypothetical protein